MSASLVGSEMCIRDRGEAQCTRLGEAHCAHWSETLTYAGVLSCNYRPVSYTHLTLPTICSV
eukprot:13334116-Alexandrium_andersonii.AAC.1